MRRRVSSRCAVVAGLVFAGVAADVSAEEALAVRLDYDAPAACPGRSGVVADIRARTSRLSLSSEGEAARVLRLHVEGSGSSFRGALEVVEVDGATMRRDIEGPTCEAVVSAMAIVAALALDPLGASVAPDASPPVAARSESAPAAAPAVPVDPAPAPPPWPVVTPPAPPAPEPTLRVSPRPASPRLREPASGPPSVRTRLWLGAGLDAEMAGLSAPDAIVAPVGFVEVGFDAAGVVAPSLRVGFVRAEGASVQVSTDSATFTWLLGRVEPCPLRLRLLATVAVRPCVGVDLGEVSASTTGAPDPKSPQRVWADGTVEGRVEWAVLGPLSLELEAGLMVPFTRNRFVFEPKTSPSAYQPPAVTGVGSAGARVRFW